ncbi:endonuclease III domain-containing protein [Mariprofundus sp. NF]|uniref:endonuclease III domain-containing protein n=1 Tax=Mariprofundus sp. NF TaxID=2608716 RepID=UPI0018266CD8|nr:endonuclease III domain-containing protein [Mariprofundus sp. NF]NWF38560.1 endonuclease III domain-containing protein [Mariprofundus sp. NF]
MNDHTPLQIFETLLTAYGYQLWWPAESPFEMMVGAVLTQNTNWKNVEQAIGNLKAANMLDAASIACADHEQLAEVIRPSGFFNQKACRLQLFSRFYIAHGEISGLKKQPMAEMRAQLLALSGIGPETADSMLLYGLEKPIFVVDAYTRRIFTRLGLLPEKIDYDGIQNYFHQQLEPQLSLFQEYHALIVEHAKRHCRSQPVCDNCPLHACCASSGSTSMQNSPNS